MEEEEEEEKEDPCLTFCLDGWQHYAVPVHQHRRGADPLPQRGGQEAGLHGDQAVHRGQTHHTEGEPAAGQSPPPCLIIREVPTAVIQSDCAGLPRLRL